MNIGNFVRKHGAAMAAALIVILVAARIVYVNICYPQTERVYYEMDDTISFHNLDIHIDRIRTFDEAEFAAFAQEQIDGYNSDIFTKGVTYNYYVYIVDVTLTNQTEEEQIYAYGVHTMLEIGAVSNGAHTYLNSLLNESPTKVGIEAGKSRTISIAYVIANNHGVSDKRFAQLRDMECTYSFKSFYKMMIVRCHSQKGR